MSKNKEKEQSEIAAVMASITSMKIAMDIFMGEIEKEIKENPKNVELNGVKFGYKTAISQFNNRFLKYLP